MGCTYSKSHDKPIRNDTSQTKASKGRSNSDPFSVVDRKLFCT